MTLAFVYAPFSGRVTNLDNGACASHFACSGESGLVDIGTSGSVLTLYLYVNYPTIAKIYISTQYLCCCKTNNVYRKARIIDLYATNNRYVGSVLYGHINTDIGVSDGWHPLSGSSFGPLGQVSAGSCCPPCGCSSCCYTGTHTHMGCYGGIRMPLYCGQWVSGGSTAIYRFEFY